MIERLHSRWIRRTLVRTCLVGFVACTACPIWVDVSYDYRMPKVPRPESGRVYSLIVDHGVVVYVTKHELAFANFAFYDFLVIGMLLFGVVFFLRQRYPNDFGPENSK